MKKREKEKIKKALDSYNQATWKYRECTEEEREKKLHIVAVKSLLDISLLIPNYRW